MCLGGIERDKWHRMMNKPNHSGLEFPPSQLNPFAPNASILCPPKISENCKVF